VARLHGTNHKASNLINMLGYAHHETLLMADSDAGVGLVTCLYRGLPTPGVWSRLGAMYVNEWYIPSVLLTWLFGYESYASGQTLCMRRSVLRGRFDADADGVMRRLT
jgi:ceramide glucosyltransferase